MADVYSLAEAELSRGGRNRAHLHDSAAEYFDSSSQPNKQIYQPILVRASDLIQKPQPLKWLVRGYIEAQSLGLLFGPPGSGKSFCALDMGGSISAGIQWHGSKVTQGPVIYVAGEGHAGIARRLKAWAIARQSSIGDDFFISKRAVPFLDVLAVLRLCDEIEQMAVVPVLVVIDTLARAFAGGDENSTGDMSQFVAACDQIRSQFECTVLIVHHSGHEQGRARGSSSLKAAVDCEFALSRDANDPDAPSILKCTKAKDAEPASDLAFKLRQVELPWLDDEGQPMTSAVIDEVDLPERVGKQPAQPTGKNQTKALGVLRFLYQENQKRLVGGRHDPSGAKVLISTWAHECEARDIPRNRFHEAMKALINKQAVVTEGNIYAIPAQ